MKCDNSCFFQGDKNYQNDTVGLNNYKSWIAITLAELLYKLRCNCSPESLNQNKIKLLLTNIYRTLNFLMHKSQDVCVKLWYFSKKLFCINWKNDIIDIDHAKFFFKCIANLKSFKATLYFSNLFAKICKNNCEILVAAIEEGRDNKDNENLNSLLDLIKENGEKHENSNSFNLPKIKRISTKLNIPSMDLEIDKLSRHIINRKNQNENAEEEKKEINKNQKDQKQVTVIINLNRENGADLNLTEMPINEELYNDENNFQGKNHQDQGSSNQALNGFCLTLNKCRLVEIFEELLITIPFNMDEDK